MISVPQVAETLRQIVEEEANTLAKETGFIQRERNLTGADFAQTLIFGWLGEPEITLDGLTQVAGRREVEMTASGLHQRFTQAAAKFLRRLLQRLTQVRLQAEAAPTPLLSLEETLVVLTVRWQIELLFRLWKEGGQIDEWRSKKRWRILCEVYAKLAAMVIQHWLIQLGCWQDPQRSLVKAAQVVRREAGQLMVAMREGRLEQVVRQILRCMHSGCRIDQRKQFPSTVQRLAGAPMLGGKRPPRPKSSRHRDQCRRWPAGKGWATSKPGGKAKTPVSSLT
jgi:Transposase DDE domain